MSRNDERWHSVEQSRGGKCLLKGHRKQETTKDEPCESLMGIREEINIHKSAEMKKSGEENRIRIQREDDGEGWRVDRQTWSQGEREREAPRVSP